MVSFVCVLHEPITVQLYCVYVPSTSSSSSSDPWLLALLPRVRNFFFLARARFLASRMYLQTTNVPLKKITKLTPFIHSVNKTFGELLLRIVTLTCFYFFARYPCSSFFSYCLILPLTLCAIVLLKT